MGRVAAMDDTKSILINGVTFSLADVYDIANHVCCVALDHQNKQKCYRDFNYCLPSLVKKLLRWSHILRSDQHRL